jgi:opacity protein-like surface antigen
MRKAIAIFGLFFACLFISTNCSAQGQVQVFGGYSYLFPAVSEPQTILCPGPPCPTEFVSNRASLNGWEASAAYKPTHWLGLVGDFSGHYGTVQGTTVHVHTFMAGPQISLPGAVSPFAHVLIGGANQSTGGGSAGSGNAFVAASTTSMAWAAGAGIDIKFLPHIALRAIQLDYMLTHFNSSIQNEPRASAGIVITF